MHLVINFKTYKEASGEKAINLAKKLENIKSKHTIILCPQQIDIALLAKNTTLPIFVQHADFVEKGQTTGWIPTESVKKAGAQGTLLNHSEHKLSFNQLKKTVEIARSFRLKIIICAATPDEAKNIALLKPDFIAIEPPELIGGNISVSTAKPELITDTLKQVKNIPVLCGAGIKKKSDVAKAVKLGVQGVLVASSVVLAKNPKNVAEELLKGFK
ncbi:triosephosphate isomerase [Candidatus Woesearchaeota archaeon]|nr:triosephosphate isomerase [Candidatus Woesearchaeota archaeon]